MLNVYEGVRKKIHIKHRAPRPSGVDATAGAKSRDGFDLLYRGSSRRSTCELVELAKTFAAGEKFLDRNDRSVNLRAHVPTAVYNMHAGGT